MDAGCGKKSSRCYIFVIILLSVIIVALAVTVAVIKMKLKFVETSKDAEVSLNFI